MEKKVADHIGEFKSHQNDVSERLTHGENQHLTPNTIVLKDVKRRNKKIVIGILSLVLLLILLFLSFDFMNNQVKDNSRVEISDPMLYGEFDAFKGVSFLAIFPKDISKNVVIEQYLYYYEASILKNTYQIFLECSYDQESFQNELIRMDRVGRKYSNQEIKYNESDYTLPAYVTINDFDDSYEYVLINEEAHKIIYIYIQSVDQKSIKFTHSYLPLYYESNETVGFSLYDPSSEY